MENWEVEEGREEREERERREDGGLFKGFSRGKLFLICCVYNK
jgi:hypothetical protein